MKLIGRFFFLLFSFSILTSCEKADKAVKLPQAGEYQYATIDIGRGTAIANADDKYSREVFFQLKTNSHTSCNRTEWELEFDCSKFGTAVYLNSGIIEQKLFPTGSVDFYANFSLPDSTSKLWKRDNPNGLIEKSAFGYWAFIISGTYSYTNQVYILDRGWTCSPTERYKKIALEGVNEKYYNMRYSNLDGTGERTVEIPKNRSKSFMRFSFRKNGIVLDVEPLKDRWDLRFTRYWEDSVFARNVYQPYYVNGALSNHENLVYVARFRDNQFEKFNMENAQKINFSDFRNVIGWDWKEFEVNKYKVVANQYYIIKDTEGAYYKLRFLDFYKNGEDGFIQFEYKRL